MKRTRIKGLIRRLERLLAKHGNLECTYSVPGNTHYWDRPVREVKLLEQGFDGHMKSVDIS